MNKTKIPLDLIAIASPCTASWDDMTGDDHTRFCGQCSQYVYNLSALTMDQAQNLMMEREGKTCVRFYKRADGTMMTNDCPVGWRAVKRRFALIGGAAAGVVIALFGLFTVGLLAAGVRGNGNGGARVVNPVQRARDWLFPPPVCVMGEAPPRVILAPPPAPIEQLKK